LLKKRPGRGEGGAPTTRVERARLRLDRRCGCGRKVGELTGGAGCQRLGAAVAEASSAAAVGLARCWARRGGKEGHAGGRKRPARLVGRKGLRAKNREGEERKEISLFLFPNKISKSIFNSNFNSL